MILKKNQTIAVLVEGSKGSVTQTDAENLQYNLLGRGFRWSGSAEYIDLSTIAQWVLFVNVKTKLLCWWCDNISDETIKSRAYCALRLFSFSVSDVVKTILTAMKNPPPDYVEVKGVESGFNQKVRVYDDGDTVEFYEAGDHLLTTSAAVIKNVAKELGLLDSDKGSAVANVLFTYPDSTYSWKKLSRRVRVIEMDGEWIKGIELYREGEETNTYKKYRLSKIEGQIELLSVGK
jgi:hypothetical protein